MTVDLAIPRFPRRRLAALITSTLFLHACSTLPETTPGSSPEVDTRAIISAQTRSQQSTRAQRQSRNISTPVWQLDELDTDTATSEFERSVWFRLSQGFAFYHLHYNEQIEDEINWFRSNSRFLTEVSDRAAPFIYEILNEIERRQLPLELALLPVIESAYLPTARSPQNAAGLWQFMAPTASSLGLSRDWWYDGRHDPLASTSAALDYLEALYAQFDEDWLLALAAYNAGQGNVQRALTSNEQRNQPLNFWSLSLPRETQRHVPRLIALAYVMADPEANGINLSLIPNEPYLAAYDAGSQIDLNLVAHLAELDPETVYQLNPGYLQWATPPDGPHTIWLPAQQLPLFEQNLAEMGDGRITWDRYVIQPGDTLSAIARRFNTQVNILQDTNALSGTRIVAGQTLLIPRAYRSGEALPAPNMVLAAANSQPVPSGSYQVRSGDSLWGIANRYRLTVDELTEWNRIAADAVLRPGQQLTLQPPAFAQASAQASMSDNNNAGAADLMATRYEVKAGDSLSRIARQHGVSVNDLTEWNSIRRSSVIRPGQELLIYPTP